VRDYKFVFSNAFAEDGLRINYLDVGARGEIGEPWSRFAPDRLKVVGFEPDPVECQLLSERNRANVYYPHALWGESTTRSFYLNEWESTSSMYPANEDVTSLYQEKHWTGRKPKRELPVQCVALDEVLRRDDMPDFIKLDTQGSEYQIILGGQKLLRENHPIVLAETWCERVYDGAPLTHEVMGLMYDLGYTAFEVNVAASWLYRTSLNNVNGKARTIGFDILFMKRPDALHFTDLDRLLKFAGLAELFGFRDYGAYALESSSMASHDRVKNALSIFGANNRWEISQRGGIRNIVNRILRRNRALWPRLH
jgi:FkbM family methyltransferase